MRRYPIEPLMTAARVPSMAALRAMFPMNGTAYRQVLHEGLSEVQADRWAVRLGFTPIEVWPDWIDGAEVECAASDCTARFVPARKGHRYCSKRCGERVRMRAVYAADEQAREARKAASARYYEEAGDYVRARMRRRHHANRDAELERMRRRYQARKAGSPQQTDGTVAA